MQPGEWAFSLDHREPCRILAADDLWGRQGCLVWLPRRNEVIRVSRDRLSDVGDSGISKHHIVFACAAARIADSLERDALVAPLEATVIPLPHQLLALQRAMSGDRVRYLLADEVGLGKTIEAGLILRELKIRGLVQRVLVVAPAGLVTQWVSEMKIHFNEDFRLVLPGTFSTWRQVAAIDEMENLWRIHHQVICPLDSVKPLDSRRGWSREQISRYNRERFEDLVSAGWDLIIIDEAHRLGGSSDQVARYRLAESLAQASPYLLLLSATPHQGKTDAFRRLMNFLDSEALPDDESVRRENVAPYVIRTEKRHAIDAEGNPLFKPRFTQTVPVAWGESGSEQQALYTAVTEYVRDGYNQAMREKRNAIGFLMILMQRLVTSSTAAIRTALEKRLEVLELPSEQLSLFPEEVSEDWIDLDGQEQMETLLKERLQGLKNERSEVELLLSAARRCEAHGPDVKAEALLEWIQRLQRDESDPDLKVLIFTEFVPTQQMLAGFLSDRGFPVVRLNGSMGLEERREVQDAFAGTSQILVSTEAGGEGLNLQFAHVVVNYDLPWNPMKLEQRIGRVDRIGQKHVVRALNFALEESVELRVREVLEEKLKRILEEFGVDKLGDVLDSEEGGIDFNDLYIHAVLAPGEMEKRAEVLAGVIRHRAEGVRSGTNVLQSSGPVDPAAARKIANHQMPFWTEQMTLAFLRSRSEDGARVDRDEKGFRLRWPDGREKERVVFSPSEADLAGCTLLTIEDTRLRDLTNRLPLFAPGQFLSAFEIPDVSDKVSGTWSLWSVVLHTPGGRRIRVFPIFLSDAGRVLIPTARLVWDRLIEFPPGISVISSRVMGQEAVEAFEASRKAAERHGNTQFQELLNSHLERLRRERLKTTQAFAARRKAVQRLGLPQVRSYRLSHLDREEQEWKAAFAEKERALPELSAIVMARVAGKGELK